MHLGGGVASVGFTLLGVAHPIQDNIPGARQVELWLCNYFSNCFVTFIFMTNGCWHVIIC